MSAEIDFVPRRHVRAVINYLRTRKQRRICKVYSQRVTYVYTYCKLVLYI